MALTDRQSSDFEVAIARNLSASTILARYDICFRVEDVADIAFWQALLRYRIQGKKVKFFPFVRQGRNCITGKAYIMSHRYQANPNYILCVVYLYMQGHAVCNLICRIGKAIMDVSFEQQILIPSFSVDNNYQELLRIKEDINRIIEPSMCKM